MPELPEVEVLRKQLSQTIVGLKIKGVEIFWPKIIQPLTKKKFAKQIINKTITSVTRRAKMLIINLTDSSVLVIHLKMTGQIIFTPSNKKSSSVRKKIIIGGHPDNQINNPQPSKYTRLIVNFYDGSAIYFNDLRKFGWARLIDNKNLNNLIKDLGPEPLSKSFTEQKFIEIFKNYPNRPIKQILLDQKLIAGIGNIYADESCFLAGLRPDKKSKELARKQLKKLCAKIISVLKLSISKKGTSYRDYRQTDGSLGGFVPYLNVYGRTNKPCRICGNPIKKIKLFGRGTHFCSNCQK